MNCHFVTQWLTKDWEYLPGSFYYYDFEEKKVKRQFAKYLFAEEDTNTKEIEDLISKYVEQPLKALKLPLETQSEIKVDKWEHYRATFLYFMIQVARYAKVRAPPKDGVDLDEMLLKGEEFLDQLVGVSMQKNQIVALTMPPGQILFYPEVGFFQFPVKDPGCITDFTFGYAVPITPFVALAKISKTADMKHLHDNRGQLSSFSIGLSGQKGHVVIPKIIREQKNDLEISKMLESQRQAAIAIVAGTHEIRDLVVQMYESAGMPVGPKKLPGEP